MKYKRIYFIKKASQFKKRHKINRNKYCLYCFLKKVQKRCEIIKDKIKNGIRSTDVLVGCTGECLVLVKTIFDAR